MIGFGRTLVLVSILLVSVVVVGGCGQSADNQGSTPTESSSDYSTGYDATDDSIDGAESDGSSQMSEMKSGARQNAHDTCMGAGRRAIAKEYGASGQSELEAAEAIAEHYDSAAKQDVIEGCMAGFAER